MDQSEIAALEDSYRVSEMEFHLKFIFNVKFGRAIRSIPSLILRHIFPSLE